MRAFRKGAVLALLFVLGGALLAYNDRSARAAGDTEDANDLSMQVNALEKLYHLKLTIPQMRALNVLAKDCAMKKRQRDDVELSAKLRKAFNDLRTAYLEGNADRIDELTDTINTLEDAEQVDFDDKVDITDEARKQAAKALELLYASQVTAYLGSVAEEDIPAPLKLLVKTMRVDGKGKKPTAAQWKETREEVARKVGWQVGGIDPAAAQKVSDQVTKLLDRAYALNAAELKKHRLELEKSARGITSAAGPMDVLRNFMEHELATLLSNPQTTTAIAARLPKPK
jgi:hypothetical protein